MLNRKGFTLVELMIVVAIIGILAAIAVPNFMSMQYKTKRSEVPMNMKAIKTSEEAYKAADNVYISATAYPSAPSENPQQWVASASGGFQTLGWSPDGPVRGSYAVAAPSNQDFTITGTSDVDGVGGAATYTATSSVAPVLTTARDVY